MSGEQAGAAQFLPIVYLITNGLLQFQFRPQLSTASADFGHADGPARDEILISGRVRAEANKQDGHDDDYDGDDTGRLVCGSVRAT